MAYEIKSVSYPAIRPILKIEADSLDDLAAIESVGEGSKCKIGNDTYTYDDVNGWGIAGEQGKELPDAPEDNGSYVLTATVSASGVALSWESTAST